MKFTDLFFEDTKRSHGFSISNKFTLDIM